MVKSRKIYLAQGEEPIYLLPEMANRHGLIAGATGTGKTVTLKVLAEAFSELGVPVFLADVKGDLAGLCRPGQEGEALRRRIEALGLRDFRYQSYPTRFWDIFGEEGHAVRTTVSAMGPLLFSRLLGLNDTQTGVLTIVFRIADDNDLLLLDLKDLRALLQYVGEHGKEFSTKYGNVSRQSVGAIQRALLTLEDQGAEYFFGEPALDIDDWLQLDAGGRGYINILHCVRLFSTPALYAAFLLWMLGELFERLPEVGDTPRPRLVFFFDEAHLLFDDVPKVLLQRIEQVVRLIRSKGVGVYFVTQNPCDIPDGVLAQLGNRVQHALRAYTPAEQRSVRAAAASFRPNPAFSTEAALSELGTGEALISLLDAAGRPGVVQRAMVLPPQSLMGAIERGERERVIAESELDSKYARPVDRWSAYEQMKELNERDERQRAYEAEQKAWEAEQKALAAERARQQKAWEKEQARLAKEREKAFKSYAAPARRTSKTKKSALEKFTDQTINTMGREVGKSLVRGLFGTLGKK